MKGSLRAISFGFLFLAAACGRQETRPTETPKPAPTEREELAALEASDRAELVTPAPAYWQPENSGTLLKLTLTVENTEIPVGGKFRYRLDIQNVGSRDYLFDEEKSYIKIGENSDSSRYQAIVTFPSGLVQPIMLPMLQFDGLQPQPEVDYTKLSPAEADAAFRREEAKKRVKNDLHVTLHPGETLSTRPDSPAPNRFRTLITAYPFTQPGTFRIKIVYDNRLDGQGIRVESNSVEFKIIP